MIQLKVYDDSGDQFFLDMYETSPLKINLSIEDITTSETSSNFSRAFRVPANGHNAPFFKTAFEVEGLDFNVTIKKHAEVLVDGNQFRTGHIRLQKIYRNAKTGLIDYEILFMGETRDFSSIIGDSKMCELQIPDITHTFDGDAVLDSWAAYPDSPQATGTTGLVNGNVIYPLIDFGNTYDNNGCVEQPRIATNHTSQGSCSGNDYFTNQGGQPGTHGINYTRFKPMIRAKKLWDAIFDRTGFTYTSNFIGTPGDNDEVGLFKQLYVSAFGNDETITVDPSIGSSDLFEASSTMYTSGTSGVLPFNQELSDPGNNYNPQTYQYTAPATTSPNSTFTFEAKVFIDCVQGGGTDDSDFPTDYIIYFRKNGVMAATPSLCTSCQTVTLTHNLSLNPGDVIDVYFEVCDLAGNNGIIPQTFKCTSAATGQFNPTQYLDCEYKQIDFIKDVLTSFKLVMQPNPNKDNDFIIEPWANFIGTGDVLDWSAKLMNEKDLQIEPLFFTQTDEIDFNMEEDSDQINTYHKKVWKETYGYLEFDSNSELLKGKRDIAVNYAPTPMGVIDGDPNNSNWVIPKIRTVEAEDQGPQHLPIKAKTRFLFYNGGRINENVVGSGTLWYFDTATTHSQTNDTTGGIAYYGQVSPISGSALDLATDADLILQWYKDVIYYVPNSSFAPYTNWAGQSMYETYWSAYIQSLYASGARRVTAYFTLNELDLYDFTFDKVIFLNGTYYRVEKIMDAQVGTTNPTKVQLIKLLDYRPVVRTEGAQGGGGGTSPSPAATTTTTTTAAPATTTTTTAAPTTTTTTTAAPTTTTTTTAAPGPTTTTTTTAAPQNYFYYTVEDCLDQTIVQVRAIYDILAAGQNAVIYNGRCYEVAGGGSANTNDITAAYADCATCAQRQLNP